MVVPVNQITFSIITAVYNCEDFIKETVDSVLKYGPQGDFEYIVIDDGSTDRTSVILRDYEGLIKLVMQPNAGEAAAVNNGLRQASGEYCLVVSADDPLTSSKLFSLSRNILDNRSDVVATYPDWQIIDGEGLCQRVVRTLDYSLDRMLGLNVCIPGPGAIFRLKAARDIHGRDTTLRYGSDFDFWLRISRLGELCRIPENLAQWRLHENSTSIKSRGPEMALERVKIIESYLSRYAVSPRLGRKAMGNAYYSAAILRYFNKEVPHRRLLWKAFYVRKAWIETARIHEIVYLLFIPFTEILWNFLRRNLLKRQSGI